MLTISVRLADLVRQNVAVDPDKVRVLYNGYDVDELYAEAEDQKIIRAKWGVPTAAFVVGICGRLETGEGQHLLISAGKHLIQTIPNLYIMIVGDETDNISSELARLKNMAVDFGLNDRVIFTGYQNPPGIIVPAFDLSVLATKKETFGSVILEAMALGIPAIGSKAGGVPEIIDDGVTGLLFKSEESADLARAIQRLYDNPELRHKFSVAGVNKVRSKFSRESHVAGLEKALI